MAWLGWTMLAVAGAQVGAASAVDVDVRVRPPQPLIEQTRFGQAVNFELDVVNNTADELELTAIKAVIRDRAGVAIQKLEINKTGNAPAIYTVPQRIWAPGEAHIIFNPFHTLSGDIALGRMDFTLVFRATSGQLREIGYSVRPVAYRQKTRLVLPMAGRVWIYDGHDFTSHHRRLDFDSPGMKKYGKVEGNASRYSYDFVAVDAEARPFRGTGSKPEDYFSYGYPVLAPAAGTIIRAVGDASDLPTPLAQQGGLKAEQIAKDPFAEAGNYVIIDHGNGEFSQFGHFKNGSLKVKVGDRVRAGQVIALAGRSGSSLFPHVHYQLTAGPNVDSEGLPIVFDNVTRVVSDRKLKSGTVWIDSGDIIESRR